MKTFMAVFLLLVSTSLLAKQPDGLGRPDCSLDQSCGQGRGNPNNRAEIPEPGILALIGLGMAGLVVARKRKR